MRNESSVILPGVPPDAGSQDSGKWLLWIRGDGRPSSWWTKPGRVPSTQERMGEKRAVSCIRDG